MDRNRIVASRVRTREEERAWFIVRLCSGFGNMVVRLLSGRKSFFQILSKAITVYMIVTLSSELLRVVVFGISTIADFVYFNEINFENVRTEVEIKTP